MVVSILLIIIETQGENEKKRKELGLFVFNDMSTLVGYLMPNPDHTYIWFIFS